MSFPLVLEYENAVAVDDFNSMLGFAKNATESEWALMNDVEETGEFWLGKRILATDLVLPSWHQKIVDQREHFDFTNITEPRKIQRFGVGDNLGPLRDKDHVPEINYGSILFLNEPFGAEIVFPEYNYSVKAKANKLVVYPANTSYIIKGPEVSQYLYFSTVFFNLN